MALCHQVNADKRHPPEFAFRAKLRRDRGECIVAKEKRSEAFSAMQTAIGQRIRWARELVEPNRAAFARDLGVDRTTLQKIEDGDRAPSVFAVIEIAHRLRVSTDYILLGTLRGVDGELAGLLASAHPELLDHSRKATAADIASTPRRQAAKR